MKKFTMQIFFLSTFLQSSKNKESWPFKTRAKKCDHYTTSFMNLVDYFINNREFKLVSIGWFTQDCSENVFSQLREKNVIPNYLQFKNDLKIVAMTMYWNQYQRGITR